jgi:hypothetical protein
VYLYIHSPIHLHGVVLNWLSTRTTLPFTIIVMLLGELSCKHAHYVMLCECFHDISDTDQIFHFCSELLLGCFFVLVLFTFVEVTCGGPFSRSYIGNGPGYVKLTRNVYEGISLEWCYA